MGSALAHGERDRRLRNLYGGLITFELSAGAAIFIAFSQLPLFRGDLAAPLGLLRGALWIAWIYLQLHPLRRWQAEPSEHNLRSADSLLQVFGARHSILYGASWILVEAIQFASAYALAPNEAGTAELLVFGTLGIGTALGTWSLMNPLLDNLLIGYQLELSETLSAAGIAPSRPTRSMTARTVNLLVGVSCACVLGTASMGASWRLEGIREAGLATAVAQATRVAAGLDEPDLTQRLHERELPEFLAVQLSRAQDPQNTLSAYQSRNRYAWGAVRAGPGSWVVAHVEVEENSGILSLLLMVFAAVVALTVSVPAYALGRAMELPLEQFGDSARRFAEHGELRALERVVPLSGDSISRLAVYFGQMLDNLEQLAAAAESVAQGDLRTQLEQPGELYDAFRGMVARLRESTLTLRETAAALADATAEIDALTLRQDRSAARQAERSTQASLSLSTLASTAQDIAQTAKHVLLDAERGERAGQDMSSQIASLDQQTETIGELLAGIREVADRSDLLALNGALEATRAGELGRNFTLVASEMRRLAERVADLVSEVDRQLALMREASSRTLAVAREREQLDRRTADAARAISRMTERQSLETEKVSTGISEIAAQSMTTAEVAAHTRNTVEAMREQAVTLEALSAGFEV